MILAFLLALGAVIWLPATACALIGGAVAGLWFVDQMLGAPVAGPARSGRPEPPS